MANLQIILFDVGGTECALRRNAVQELLPLPHLWRPPGLPRPVAGFFSLSGTAVPVIELEVLFGLDEDRASPEAKLYRHLILIKGIAPDLQTALLVNRVEDYAEISNSHLSPVRTEGTLNGCIEAEIDLDGRLVHLLSLQRILLAGEQRALIELNRQAQSRLDAWSVGA